MNTRSRHFIEQVLKPATSPAVLSWPVLGLATTFSVLVHLLASPEFSTQALGERVLASAVAVAPMFSIIAIAQAIPARFGTARVAAVLMSFAIGGGMRGWILSLLLDSVPQLPGQSWQFRIPSSALFMGSTTLLFTYGWATYRAHRRSASRLLEETLALHLALEHLERESKEQESRQLGRISAGIVHDLQSLAVDPAQTQIAQIQRLIDDEVRPLSRALAAEVTTWSPEPRSDARRPQLRALEPLQHLPSPWWNVVQMAAPVPAAYFLFGTEAALRLPLFVGLALLPSAWACNTLARRWLAGLTLRAQCLGITLGYALVATAGVSASRLAMLGTPDPSFYVATGFITETASAWVLIIGSSFWTAAVDQEQRLRAVHADLQWAIARINLLAWFNRGVITRLLHGPIQNAMHAAVMRLRGHDPNEVVEGVIDELRVRISTASPNRDHVDVNAALDDIVRLWRGIADITVEVDAETLHALQQDPASGGIVLDLVQEVCSNAIRHGSATAISVHIESEPRLVNLAILDDGLAHADSSKAGVGQQFIETCSVAWQRRSLLGRNRLDVSIPCAGSDERVSAGLFGLESVADVAHGADEVLEVAAELHAQPTDVDVDRAGATEVVVAPDLL